MDAGEENTVMVDRVALRPGLSAQRTLGAWPCRGPAKASAALRCAGGGMVAARSFPPRRGVMAPGARPSSAAATDLNPAAFIVPNRPAVRTLLRPRTGALRPAGTKEISRRILPSLRDLDSWLAALPSHKWLGYCQSVSALTSAVMRGMPALQIGNRQSAIVNFL